MFTVRYSEKYEYGYSCYIVVDENGKDRSKFYSEIDAENNASFYNQLVKNATETQAAQECKYTRLDELQSCYSDFFKEINGFRPRSMSAEQWESESWLSNAIDGLHRYIKTLGETEGGRCMLREMGFVTTDADADNAYRAKRDAEYAAEDARYAEADKLDAQLRELLEPLTIVEQIENDLYRKGN
jgi:hypothetical protein